MRVIRMILVAVIMSAVVACNSIETEESLSKSELNYIREVSQLDSGEKIYKFYSNFRIRNAGHYFTDKRLGCYWIDEQDSNRDLLASAYYTDIISIDTVYYAGATYSPYMLVKKSNGKVFKVCAGGKREEIQSFFEDALALWNQKRKG